MSELQRIRADLAKCKRLIAEIEAGQHMHGSETGEPTAMVGLRAGNRLSALRRDQTRLESDLLQTLIAQGGKYAPGEILARMEAPALVGD